MAVAITKDKELIDKFIAILAENRTFQGFEELEYRRELNHFLDGTLEGDELRAFYYACTGNVSKSISYFKKSLAYNEPDFMENYLIYLMTKGFVREYISETIKINNQLSDNPTLLIQLARATLLNGDFEGMINVRKNLIKLGEKYVRFLDEEIRDLKKFQTNLKLSDEQLRFLIDTSVNIVEKNEVNAINIHFKYFEEGDEVFNLMTFYTRCDDVNLLVDMDFELAKAIAKNPSFIGKRFSPSFENFEYEKDMENSGYAYQV